MIESESAFRPGLAYWVDGKEIAHFDADNVIDLRLISRPVHARSLEANLALGLDNLAA